MNKKLFATIVCLALIAVGCAITYFAQSDIGKTAGFAVTMLCAGMAVNQMWKERKPEAKPWLVILGIILVGAGSFVAGMFMLMTEAQIQTYIGMIVAVILFIAGLVSVYLGNKTKKNYYKISTFHNKPIN